MDGKRRVSRAQSAMEYLMTYGWAILIIAVVLAALFSLNVFNAGAQLGTSCIGQPGYSCSSPSITQNGLLSFSLGLGTGVSATYAWLSCASSANSATPSSMQYYFFDTNGLVILNPNYQGSGLGLNYGSGNNIGSGATLSVQSLPCYPATGGTTGMLTPIGSGFTGTVWMVFEAPGSTSWTPQFTKIATVSVKSTS